MASFQVVVISITVIWRQGTHRVIRFLLSPPTLLINVRSLSLVFSQLATGCLYSPYEISSSLRAGRPETCGFILSICTEYYFLQSPKPALRAAKPPYQIATR